MFLIEDQSHAEVQEGEYPTLIAAILELERRATIPWDQPPNLPPCTGWRTCSRYYEVIEYDSSTRPWRELRRMPFLHVSAEGIRWLAPHTGSVAGPAA